MSFPNPSATRAIGYKTKLNARLSAPNAVSVVPNADATSKIFLASSGFVSIQALNLSTTPPNLSKMLCKVGARVPPIAVFKLNKRFVKI